MVKTAKQESPSGAVLLTPLQQVFVDQLGDAVMAANRGLRAMSAELLAAEIRLHDYLVSEHIEGDVEMRLSMRTHCIVRQREAQLKAQLP